MNIDKINSLIESHILVFTYFCNFLVQITNDLRELLEKVTDGKATMETLDEIEKLALFHL